MRRVIRVSVEEIQPDSGHVLRRQGIPSPALASPRVTALLDAAREEFARWAQPIALVADVSRGEFIEVYSAEGVSESDTPLADVTRRAWAFALFAATLGARLDEEIRARVAAGDAALGAMLDAVAGTAAERLADVAASRFLESLAPTREERLRVLPYSPGYCGWDIRGQQPLFARLDPGMVGISLNDRCVMQPVKSVSGVLVAGPPEAHRISPRYPFCEPCATRACVPRMRSIR